MDNQNKDRVFSFRIPQDVLDELGAYAKENHISKGSVVCIALSELFARKKVVNSLSEISNTLTLLSNGKELDEETEKKLDDFQKICALAVGKSL